MQIKVDDYVKGQLPLTWVWEGIGVRCIQCDNKPYKHPQTGKVYKLCAVCGLKAISKLLNLDLSKDIEPNKRLDDILSVRSINDSR